MDILAALDDEHLFRPHFNDVSWASWRSFLAALFGLPMTLAEFELFKQCTGRSEPPSRPFAEACVIVGRRGGKSRTLALIAVYLAIFQDYAPYLAPGEVATIAILAQTRDQARSIYRYIQGLIKAVPLIAETIEDDTSDTINLSNRVAIEIRAASFRSIRGYTFAAVLCDETALWRTDEASTNPDVEILRALRPGLASIPGSVLLIASSPYAKKGEVYVSFRRNFGKDDAPVLVWKAPTEVMNPRVDPAVIAEAYATDPEAARSEYGAEFRDDLTNYVSREALDAVTAFGITVLQPEPGVSYAGFIDVSGGGSDSMTCAIGYLRDGRVAVLAAILEIRAPFDPDVATAECSALLRQYGVSRVAGDHYAGAWAPARFAEFGITFEQSARAKSALYLDLIPLINSKRVELLDNPRLISQIANLERRTARGGKDSVDHPRGMHDDLANVAAGVLVGLDLDRRPALVRQADLLEEGLPVSAPARMRYVFGVLTADQSGVIAVVYAAKPIVGPLVILDFERSPMHGRLIDNVRSRLRELAQRCPSCLFVPSELLRHASLGANEIRVFEIPSEYEPATLLLSAASHVGAGAVKLTELASEKARSSPLEGSLDFRAGESLDDNPLRSALVLTIALALDDAAFSPAAAKAA